MPYSNYPKVPKHVIARFEELQSLGQRMQAIIETLGHENNIVIQVSNSSSLRILSVLAAGTGKFGQAYPDGFNIMGPSNTNESDL